MNDLVIANRELEALLAADEELEMQIAAGPEIVRLRAELATAKAEINRQRHEINSAWTQCTNWEGEAGELRAELAALQTARAEAVECLVYDNCGHALVNVQGIAQPRERVLVLRKSP